MATQNATSTKPKHIMMSYAWTGTQDLVYEVAEQLKNENIPVWMDIRNGIGGKINDGLAEAVENSAAVCFFMTPEYQSSKNCKKELEYADKLEIPLIPCRCRSDYKPSGWLGLICSGLMWFDFRDLSDQPVNATMNKLINYIQTDILKVQSTVFPDLEGRTIPIIFRNRHQFRVPQETPDTSLYITDSEEPHANGGRALSSPVTQSDRQRNSIVPCVNASLSRDVKMDNADLDIKERSLRFDSTDDHINPGKMRTPIEGYSQCPMLPLEEAIEPLIHLIDENLRRYVYIAKHNTREPQEGLTSDESASIYLYTMEWSSDSHSLYSHLNRALRAENRTGLIPWFRYLKLFLTALFKLPSQHRTVWRGVKADLRSKYREGDAITWWGVSSCTTSVKVLESEMFVGKTGTRTLFSIETINAKSIRKHSYYDKEEEVLLLPGTYLRVVSQFSPAKDLTIIHLQEISPPFPLLEPPFSYKSKQQEAPLRPSRQSQQERQPLPTTSKSPAKKKNNQLPECPRKNKSNPLLKKNGPKS